VRADGQSLTTVRQPLPLPQGVSDSAVGGREPAAAGPVQTAACEAYPWSRSDTRGGFRFALDLDLFTLAKSEGGGEIAQFAAVDFLIQWPAFEHFNPYLGIGMGLLAPRLRFGLDLHPFGTDRSGPMLELGGRYVLLTWVADRPETFQNFDPDADYAHGLMAEIGLGWRVVFDRVALRILAMYLVGPYWPMRGGGDRSTQLDPSGSAVFHGGTLSLGIEW
jgi:hypothetical protein